jgi:hypothetical protein
LKLDESMSKSVNQEAPRELPGRWVVVGMFGFGVLATGVLYVYWQLQTAPFMPLQMALAAAFEDSSPRVEGGQRKMHQNTPLILRVVMRVPFDPLQDERAARRYLIEVSRVIHREIELSDYDQLDLHLYKPDPEREIRQKTLSEQIPWLLHQLQTGETTDPADRAE